MGEVCTIRVLCRALVDTLNLSDAQALLLMLNSGMRANAGRLLIRCVGVLPREIDLSRPLVQDALSTALAYRISPDIEDPDKIVTEGFPSNDWFAREC